jgi:hypothetical protein
MKKQNLLLFLVFLSGTYINLKAEDFTFQSSTDLNGDKIPEEINLTNIDETTEFSLEISGKNIRGKFNEESSDGFIVVDIDKYDKYKEIAVHTPGPSSDDEYLIYWYNGDSIKETARLSRWPKFLGNGIVYVDGWLGFWSRRDKYILNKWSKCNRKK